MRGEDAPTLMPVPGVFPGGCLVLVAQSQTAPKPLLAALASRGLAPSMVHDEPAVMTALAGKTNGRRVLVVVEPERWSRLDELIYAVNVYHNDVLCWQYNEAVDGAHAADGTQRLSVLQPPDASSGGDSGDAPIGQIVGRHRPVDDLLVKVPGVPAAAREIVTQEELSMLLGPAPGEAS